MRRAFVWAVGALGCDLAFATSMWPARLRGWAQISRVTRVCRGKSLISHRDAMEAEMAGVERSGRRERRGDQRSDRDDGLALPAWPRDCPTEASQKYECQTPHGSLKASR